MSFSKEQRVVARGMGAGLLIAVAGLSSAVFVEPSGVAAGSLPGRLQLFALSVLPACVSLAFSIARLASRRFHFREDLAGSGVTEGSERARVLQARLQNTVEQIALALPVYGVRAVFAPTKVLNVLLAAAILFGTGRVLFFWGYDRGARHRSFGFALTF